MVSSFEVFSAPVQTRAKARSSTSGPAPNRRFETVNECTSVNHKANISPERAKWHFSSPSPLKQRLAGELGFGLTAHPGGPPADFRSKTGQTSKAASSGSRPGV